MVAFIPAPDCALVEVIGNQSGQPCEFTFAVQHSGAYDLANMVALAGAVDGWYNDNLLSSLPSSVTYEGVTVRGLSSEVDLRYDLSEPLPGLDTVNDPFPAQVALCVTKRTGFTGRSARGRMYFWGINSQFRLDDRHIDDAGMSGYGDTLDPLVTAVAGAGWAVGVLSYQTAGAPRVTALFTLLDHFQIRDNRLDTQRRRLGKS